MDERNRAIGVYRGRFPQITLQELGSSTLDDETPLTDLLLTGEGPLCGLDLAFDRFLNRLGRDSERASAFVARNFLLDEGIKSARAETYRKHGCLGAHVSVEAWRKLHSGYLDTHVRLSPEPETPGVIDPADEDSCPETFRFGSDSSGFKLSDPHLHLIRIEEVGFIAKKSESSQADIRKLVEALHRPGFTAQQHSDLSLILERWNTRKDGRPVFAAFYEEVKHVWDGPGWADELRDLLGLAHLDPVERGGPLDVLAFRYKVGDVSRLADSPRETRPLLPPTVLDADHSAAFCPAPRGEFTGHVVDLSGRSETLRREIVHPKIAFTVEHLYRIGRVERAVDLSLLPLARGLHLNMVRTATGRSEYAHGTDGDLL